MFMLEIEVRGAAPVVAKRIDTAVQAKADFLAVCKIPLNAIVRLWYDGRVVASCPRDGVPVLSGDINWE